jgi:hypothetical protein
MDQEERFSLSFDRIKNGMALDLKRLWEERRVPIDPSRSDQRDATPIRKASIKRK